MLQEWTEPNSFNVCIAPYKHFFRGYAAFTRVRWRCLVIDEMQRVRGMTERHWEAVFTLRRSDPRGPLGVLGVADGGVCVVLGTLSCCLAARFPSLGSVHGGCGSLSRRLCEPVVPVHEPLRRKHTCGQLPGVQRLRLLCSPSANSACC